MSEKIAVALSGGIDSSAALYLLKKKGYDVAGVTMRHFLDKELGFDDNNGIEATILQAKKVCDFLEVEHIVIDVTEDFHGIVMRDFIAEYQKGRTPNPCTLCNRTIKWGIFLDKIAGMGFHKMATGHYIRMESRSGKYRLYRSEDIKKDQSYMLWQLNQKQLAKTLFPLAGMNKQEVKQVIIDNGLPVRTDTESQEVCFISGHYSVFLEKYYPLERGDIVLEDGEVIGSHHGLPLYTIGQRKGIHTKLNDVLFVLKLDIANNRLVVTKDPDRLLADSFRINKVNWIADEPEINDLEVQIRYNSRPVAVENLECRGESLEIKLKKPVRAITPGQSAVFYCNEELIGGGVIINT